MRKVKKATSIAVLVLNIYLSFIIMAVTFFEWNLFHLSLTGRIVSANPLVQAQFSQLLNIDLIALPAIALLCIYAGYACPWRWRHYLILVTSSIGLLLSMGITHPYDRIVFSGLFLVLVGFLYLAGYRLYRFRLKSQKSVLPTKAHP